MMEVTCNKKTLHFLILQKVIIHIMIMLLRFILEAPAPTFICLCMMTSISCKSYNYLTIKKCYLIAVIKGYVIDCSISVGAVILEYLII